MHFPSELYRLSSAKGYAVAFSVSVPLPSPDYWRKKEVETLYSSMLAHVYYHSCPLTVLQFIVSSFTREHCSLVEEIPGKEKSKLLTPSNLMTKIKTD